MDSPQTLLHAWLEATSVPVPTVARLAGVPLVRLVAIAEGDEPTDFEASATEAIFCAGFTWEVLGSAYHGKPKTLAALSSAFRQFCETKLVVRRMFEAS